MEKQISISFVIAYAGWVTSFAILAIAWVTEVVFVGHLAVIVCAAAATTTVRLHMRQHAEEIRNAMTVLYGVQPRKGSEVRPLR